MTAARSEVRACAKFVHVSPRKARLVVDHIRGRTVPEARTILAFMPRAAVHDVEKVLRSAVANAESNPNLRWNGDDLVISSAYVDEGPTLKRWQAARAWTRQPDPEAHLPHHDHARAGAGSPRRGTGSRRRAARGRASSARARRRRAGAGRRWRRWVRKCIRAGCASASSTTGSRTGW